MRNRFLFNIQESASVGEKIPTEQPKIQGILPGFPCPLPAGFEDRTTLTLFFPPFFRDVSWSDLMSSTIQVWSQFVLNCDLSTLSGLWWPMHNLVNTLDLHLCFVLVLKSTGRSHKETRHGIQGSLYRCPVKWTKTNKLHFSKAESRQMCVFLWTQFWIYYLVGSKTDYSSFISS